jgi:anti-sigma factor RsiW
MDCATYREIAAADVDGRLDAAEQAEARAHVAGCPACERLQREQRAIKALLHQKTFTTPAPDQVRARVLGAIAGASMSAARPWQASRLVLAGSIAAAALLLGLILPRWRASGPDLLEVLARDVHTASADLIELMAAGDVEALRRYYDDSGQLSFRNTIVDLTALGFRPIGGAIVPIGNVPATFTVYESPHGKLICRRFAAGAIALPSGGKRFNGAELFTVRGITVRIVRDGDAICCFASDIPYDTLVAYLERARHH